MLHIVQHICSTQALGAPSQLLSSGNKVAEGGKEQLCSIGSAHLLAMVTLPNCQHKWVYLLSFLIVFRTSEKMKVTFFAF